jgi:peptidoglycan/xylan/chitin deacetylase (PgdA/CDA1 family)
MRFPGFKRKAFTVSYDDGTIHDIRMVETMMRHGIKGTLNINSSGLGANANKLTVESLVDLIERSGFEIAVHGYRHLSLALVPSGEATYAVMKDRETLEGIFGRVIKGMAYANGSYSDDVVKILECCGIEYSRTTVSTESFAMPTDWLRLPTTCHHKNPKLMELAKKFAEWPESDGYFWRNKPQLFYVWGHSYEFNNDNNWEILEEFCEYIGGREDIWYATNGEIYEYQKAFNSLRTSHDGKILHNPTSIDVYILTAGGNVIIPAGETVKLG